MPKRWYVAPFVAAAASLAVAAPTPPGTTYARGRVVLPGVSGATAIAAGEFHVVIVFPDQSVAACGDDAGGQADVPPALTSATQIGAGRLHSIARAPGGTVVAWSDDSYVQTTIPAGAETADAVAAGFLHSMALLPDGTVAAWGDNTFGQCDVPADLMGVIAIAAGRYHSLALLDDHTVVAWEAWGEASLWYPTGSVFTGNNATAESKAIYTSGDVLP